MACVGCQKRREAIAEMAARVGTIVFGGRTRRLANFGEPDGEQGVTETIVIRHETIDGPEVKDGQSRT